MSFYKKIELWASDQEETHGGENNGGARRGPCARTGKYAGVGPWGNGVGLSTWTNARAFGTFSNGVDPARGGGVPGQVNAVDYFNGFPNLRTEHLHAIDCEGYDRLSLYWNAECTLYNGLITATGAGGGALPGPSSVTVNLNYFYADEVFCYAVGSPVIDPRTDFPNFPATLFGNTDRTLLGEGSAPPFGSGTGPRPMRLNPLSNDDLESAWMAAQNALYVYGHGTEFLAAGDTTQAGGAPPNVVPAQGDGPDFYSRGALCYGLPIAGRPVARGALQWGRVRTDGLGNPIAGVHRIPQRGDRMSFMLDVGRPWGKIVQGGGPAGVDNTFRELPDLRITGLARVYVGLLFLGLNFGGITSGQAAGTNPPTYLASDGTGSPSGAPRQLIRGRLYAVLSSQTPTSDWQTRTTGP